MSIEIIPVTELLHRYPREQRPQPVYVELDRRVLPCHTLTGTAPPIWPSHAADRRAEWQWRIPALTVGAAAVLLERLAPLAESVVAGYTRHWNGNNHVGRYSAEAEAARAAIERECEGPWSEGEIEDEDEDEDEDEVTRQIEALRREAAEAGDQAQVALCDRALEGDEAARAECAAAIVAGQG